MSRIKASILGAVPALVIIGLAACGDQPTDVSSARAPRGPSLATALPPGEPLPEYPATYVGDDVDGRPMYELDRVCDVFIGEPVIDPADGAPQRYTHQALVRVPPGAKIKLVGDAAMQESGSKLFTCDARDPDDPTQPVIDPVTLHAAKGDAPSINENGVELDLNGYSITVSPAFGEDPAFENIGVVLAGDDVTLTNSADADAAGNGVSRIFGFGHNIDVEAVRPTVQGRRFDADGDPATVDWIYNLETQGGMGIRLSAGPMRFDQVKSVNLDPVAGGGFEARRLLSGILTVTNSHFEGGTEGVFLRELQGVSLLNNYVSGGSGPAISTRQAVSTTGRPIIIRGNTVDNSAQGIVWGRDSRNNTGSLKIDGNFVTRYRTCGIGWSTRNATIAPLVLNDATRPTLSLAHLNSFDRATQQTCRLAD
ncbi:MAG TPA: right-handed parallel beta-helix repeat-containing protein [Gemmatimonadaceae bacterium]|nr:right-handed parallel beta-helix repeat-containing protein [Gemmatimonadaceae bacterium]